MGEKTKMLDAMRFTRMRIVQAWNALDFEDVPEQHLESVANIMRGSAAALTRINEFLPSGDDEETEEFDGHPHDL